MTDYRSPADPRPARRRSWLSALIFPLLAFLLGLAAMGWLLSRWDAAAAYLGIAPPPPPEQQAPPPAQPAQVVAPQPVLPAGDGQTLVLDPEMHQRVGRIEQRIAQIDNQSRQAVGNAGRAEGLLVAFAARRALDRGAQLGYIEGLLNQRFGATQPQAVATIITAARQPVTLSELQLGLQQIGPDLVGGTPERGWWSALRAELGDLVTVRRQGTASTAPAERLHRATARLEAGQVDLALAEVTRMPGRDKGGDWIAKARRYVAARNALDLIETAALLESRAGTATMLKM